MLIIFETPLLENSNVPSISFAKQILKIVLRKSKIQNQIG